MEDRFQYMAVGDETFNTIKVYGICEHLSSTYEGNNVRLLDGTEITCEKIIPLSIWQEYVDERCATVKTIKIKK